MNGNPRRRPSWEWGLAILLLLVATWFRVYRLPDVPPGLHHDDVKNILLVKKILTGYVRLYYPENYGHEPLYHWLQAAYMFLVGSGYPEVRLLSVGISLVGIALIYALVRRLLGRRVALWTLAWQAVSLWPLFYSRRAIRGVLLPPLAALTTYLFVAGLGGRPENSPPPTQPWRRWGVWVLGGVSLAACLYTYMGSRVLPLFFVLLAVYLALVHPRRLRSVSGHRPAPRMGILLFFLVALILSLPLGLYLVRHPEERMEQINTPLNALRRGEWRPLWENSLRALGMFTFLGDPHWRQFVADTPVFEPLGAILFYAGVGLCLWRWRRLEYALPLLWLPVALAPAMFSEGAPNFLRPIAVQTTVYVFPALAMALLSEWLDRRAHRRVAWLAAAGMIALLGWNAWRTYDGYFVRWPAHPDARFAYNSTLRQEGRYLNAADLDSVVLSGHFPADLDPALIDSVLRRRDLVPRWCDIRQALVFPAGESSWVVEPDYFTFDPALSGAFLGERTPLYEYRLDDGTFVFAVYPLDAELLSRRLSTARANPAGWSAATTFPDGLPGDWVPLSWPARFGTSVDLVGYEVLNEGPPAPGDEIAVITYWQAVQPASAEGTAFLHLLGPGGTVIAGYDGFGAPPNRWIGQDILVQAHRFRLPADVQPGAYPIELGWYERDTGTRWVIDLPGGRQTDRLLLQPLTVVARER